MVSNDGALKLLPNKIVAYIDRIVGVFQIKIELKLPFWSTFIIYHKCEIISVQYFYYNMAIAKKRSKKPPGQISSIIHRVDRVKKTRYDDHDVSLRDPVYQYLFKVIDNKKEKNGGNVPRGLFPSLTRKYNIYTFLNTKGLTKRYARYMKKSKCSTKLFMYMHRPWPQSLTFNAHSGILLFPIIYFN